MRCWLCAEEGESCLERRCWSEPALCCVVVLLWSLCCCTLGQNQYCAALCCYSVRQNKRCPVLLLVRSSIVLRCCIVVLVCWWAQRALLYCCVVLVRTSIVLRCCVGVLVGRTSVVLLYCWSELALLCWWAQRALGDDDKRRRFRDQVHSHRAANQRDAGSVLHSVWLQVICVWKLLTRFFLLRWWVSF